MSAEDKGGSVVEERLSWALKDLASRTHASADGWDRIEDRASSRRRRRVVAGWAVAPVFALAAAVVLAVVVVPDRRDPSVTAGPAAPAERAYYAPQGLDDAYTIGSSGVGITPVHDDDGLLHVYGRRSADGVTLDGVVLVVTARSADGASVLRSTGPSGSGLTQSCVSSPPADCIARPAKEATLRSRKMLVETTADGFKVVWDEVDDLTLGVLTLGVPEADVPALVEGVILKGGEARAGVLPDGFAEVHRGVWPPMPETLAPRSTEQSWAHAGDPAKDFSLAAYEGPALTLDSFAWLWPDAVATEVGGRPALYRSADHALTWAPAAGVVLVVSGPLLDEAGLHTVAELVRPLGESAWSDLTGGAGLSEPSEGAVVGPRSARQRGVVIARGDVDGVSWEAAAYESTTGPRGICVQLKAVPGRIGTCGLDVPAAGRLGAPLLLDAPDGTRFLVVPAGAGVATVRVDGPGTAGVGFAVVGPAGFPMRFLVTPLTGGPSPTVVVALDAAGIELDRKDVPDPPPAPPRPAAPTRD